MRPALLVAVLSLACAARGVPAAPPPEEPVEGISAEAPPALDARVGAAQVEVRVRNGTDREVRVPTDPWLADVEVRGPAGDVRCTPPEGRVTGGPRALAPGASMSLRIDVSARCEIATPGEYRVAIAVPTEEGAAKARTMLRVQARTWVNPGPRRDPNKEPRY